MGADHVTGEIVALKRINTEAEENGFPITAIREVKILKALKHDNIVQLKEMVTSKGEFALSVRAYFGKENARVSGGSIFSCASTAPHWMRTVQTAHIAVATLFRIRCLLVCVSEETLRYISFSSHPKFAAPLNILIRRLGRHSQKCVHGV